MESKPAAAVVIVRLWREEADGPVIARVIGSSDALEPSRNMFVTSKPDELVSWFRCWVTSFFDG